jgi:O-antigen ligase
MIPRALAIKRSLPVIDKRVWPMIMGIGFFGFLIVKEVSLPSEVIMAFGGLGLLGLLMMGLQSPEIPLYVLVAYLPFSRLLVGDFGTEAYAFNMTNILTLWVLLGHAMRQGSRGEPVFQGSALSKAVWLFALMGAVSLLRSAWIFGSWYVSEFVTPLKRWLTPVFFYFLALWVVRDKRTLKTVVVLIMVAVAVVALMAIRDYEYVKYSSFEKSRVGGIAEHSNTLGAFFVYYMFLFLGFFFTFPKKPKAWLLLIPFLMCFRGIMVTFSRGAYLAFAAGGLTACWFKNKLLFVITVALGALMLLNPIFLPAGIRYRMGQTVQATSPFVEADVTESLEASSATRIRIWRGAVQMIRENPLWGVGYGTFPGHIPRYTQGAIGHMDAHNSYLLIAAEMGIPTLLVFLFVLLMAVYYTYWLYRRTEDRAMKAIALGFLAGLGGLSVANLFGSRMDSQQVSSYFWILAGLIMRAVIMEREQLRGTGKEERGRVRKLETGS